MITLAKPRALTSLPCFPREKEDSPASLRAIKILTANVTVGVEEEMLHEVDALRRLKENRSGEAALTVGRFGVPWLRKAFLIDSHHGAHLCLVFDPLGQSVRHLALAAPDRQLPQLIVKNILRDVLESLAYMHARGIVHTGELQKCLLKVIPGEA